jgi:midasin
MERSNGNSAGKTADFDVLAAQALNPKRTDEIFVNYGSLFVEICARWIVSGENSESKIVAFGRILPLAPHLAEHAEHFLSSVSKSPILGLRASQKDFSRSQESELLRVLLGTFRLLSFDCRNFTKHVRPLELTSLFHHASKTVQYLAVLCAFCGSCYARDGQETCREGRGHG